MDEDMRTTRSIDKLADLLEQRGIEHYDINEFSLVFVDEAGSAHECCEAGPGELVNVIITVTPEQALSVPDLNSVISENARLRGLAYRAWKAAEQLCQAFEGPCDDDGTHDNPCPLGEHRGCVYGRIQWELRAMRIEVK